MEPESGDQGVNRQILPWPEDYEKLPVVMTFHHHHLYEFETDKLTEALPDDNVPPRLRDTYYDHNGFTHTHYHCQKQEPTCLALVNYHPVDPLKIQVQPSTLLARTALFIESDHLHFHHQFVHLHKIFCRQMWPEKKPTDEESKAGKKPLNYRIFFPDLQTRTMTKSGVFVHDKGGFLEFHHYHSHWHTLTATAAKHPETFRPPKPPEPAPPPPPPPPPPPQP